MFLVFHLNLLFCIFLGFVYAFPPYIYDEGSPCITSDGLKGYCIEITYCPSAVADLKDKKQLPDICDFNNDKTPIVCCVTLRKSIEQCMKIRENRNFQPFIIGGSSARVGEFKHMAHIGYRGEKEPEDKVTFGCGASLISKRFLLTAAHCSRMHTKLAKVVKLGTIKHPHEKSPEFWTEGVNVNIEKFISHPNSRKVEKKRINDIALIKLEKDVTFTNLIQPACLYIKRVINETLTATGWGYTGHTRFQHSRKLLQIPMKTQPEKKCSQFLPSLNGRTNYLLNIMCLIGEKPDTDTCKGDSGGPIQIRERLDQTVYSIVAVTCSGSTPCSGVGLYTRVASYVDWIESVVWK